MSQVALIRPPSSKPRIATPFSVHSRAFDHCLNVPKQTHLLQSCLRPLLQSGARAPFSPVDHTKLRPINDPAFLLTLWSAAVLLAACLLLSNLALYASKHLFRHCWMVRRLKTCLTQLLLFTKRPCGYVGKSSRW